jgi:stress response protein SCP2
MLSVNASIQAAEAGPEAAALARELRLLSERVNTCSKDGQGSLDDIQRELQSTDVFTSSPEVDRLCQATAHHCQTFRQVESALAGVWESATEAGRVSQSAKEDSTLLLSLAQELRQALPERPSGHTP